MSIESKDDFLVLLDERIRRISNEVAAEVVGQARGSSEPLVEDTEAVNIQKALKRIMVKEFISISHPIPFLDLDGVTVFQQVKLLEWAEQPKQKLRAAS
ncbi:MAG TPA: hypothetical protein VNO50_05260 [Pyrinomonadaceae bacterium]|nr:hypothetical protein [Pyrinomonadaceae bacterium]